MLLGIVVEDSEQLAAPGGANQQHASILGDVEQHQSAGQAGDDALLAIERCGVESAVRARLAGSEPNLFAIGRPGKTLNREPLAGKKFFVSREIDDCEGAAVVTLEGMIRKCDEVAFGRDARMANPSAGLVERLSDGEFEAIAASHVANHGHAGAVGGPG